MLIEYTTVYVNRQLVRFNCDNCGAVWYMDNAQFDYQAFVTCVKCAVICEIDDDE